MKMSNRNRILGATALACVMSLSLTGGATAKDMRKRLSVPSQPVASALAQVARQSDLQLFAAQIDDTVVRSRPLNGSYTVQEALDLLLKDTGLTYRIDGGSIYVRRLAYDTSAPAERPRAEGDDAPAESREIEAIELSEIVVTAQKREERLLDVPIAISAFSGARLEATGASQLSDFLATAPGVGIVDSGDGTQSIQIRGISAFAGDATVGFYMDELPFTQIGVAALPDVRTFDLERVEVLRGPQGTLYGDGSLGGVVRILTKNPDPSRFEAKFDGTLSQTKDGGENWGAKAAVNVPIVKDKVALRIVGAYEDYSGWVDAPLLGRDDVNDRNITNLRAKLLIRPSEDLDVVFSAMSVREHTGSSSGSFEDRTSPRKLEPDNNVQYDLYSGVINWKGPGFDVVSASSYIDFKQDFVFEFIGFNASSIAISKNFSQEIRLNSTTPGPFQWTAGVFYRDLKSDNDIFLGSFGRQQLFSKSRSWAVFGEGSYSFWEDKAKATVGLRYFEDERTRDEPGRDTIEAKFHTLNPRFNLALKPVEDWLVYFNVAKGFRSGQTQSGLALQLADIFGIDLPVAINPETLWTYEAGTKWASSSGKLVIEGAVYRNDWTNMQIPISVIPNAVPGLLNAGESRVIGLDLTGSFTPIPGLLLQASGSVNKAELQQDVVDVTGVLFEKGSRIPGVAARTFSASAEYRWGLGFESAGLGKLNGMARGDWTYNSERPAGGVGISRSSDDYSMFNMRVGVENDRWGLYLFGTNLADTNAAIDAVTTTGIAVRPRPRTFGINFRIRT
jgi:iron complex outermembrane receptor protein